MKMLILAHFTPTEINDFITEDIHNSQFETFFDVKAPHQLFELIFSVCLYVVY